ncbi:MAG: hypothetical protein KatS3mg061_0431 [Dehalococcoidia bacterium]|nr:MAG: hypothetical protein KatS3mg061_0431 [Dehalococcoidia bacterium]
MRFSFYLNPQTPGPEHDTRVLNEVLGQVDLAQRLGFSDVWLTDHQVHRVQRLFRPADCWRQRSVSATGACAWALRLRWVPLRHPVQFVTQCNLIDQLTSGNFVIGVGGGQLAG